MHSVHRAWWRALMDLRPLVRFLAERFPKLAPWAIRLRSVLHLAVGNPIQALAFVDVVLLWWLRGWPTRWLAVGFLVVCLVVEVAHRLGIRHGVWLSAWREAWRFRRRWPSDWAGIAAKTTRVQAEVGTSKEPIASAVLRPVADHPKMSWWPRIEWPVVSWWVGPPPGRSLTALDELTTVLAANIPRADDVYVDYERENDSYGRLIVSFGHVLDRTSSPTWARPNIAGFDQSDDDLTVGYRYGRPTDAVASAAADRGGGRTMTPRLLIWLWSMFARLGSPRLRWAGDGLDIGRRFDARPLALPWPHCPHMLIGGETGSGKSGVCNAIIGALADRTDGRPLRHRPEAGRALAVAGPVHVAGRHPRRGRPAPGRPAEPDRRPDPVPAGPRPSQMADPVRALAGGSSSTSWPNSKPSTPTPWPKPSPIPTPPKPHFGPAAMANRSALASSARWLGWLEPVGSRSWPPPNTRRPRSSTSRSAPS